MATLREQLNGTEPVCAPLVFNPLMAKLAEAAGFKAMYLGGGATGYVKAVLEANLNLSEMCQLALEIRTVTPLPLILDAAAGFGDPMHMHRTIGMVEAAGFQGIEIEDQLLPKRAHHHIGIEHMIPQELMEAKIREAVAARRGRDLVIIARSNGVRSSSMDDALRRAEGYRRAGADLILLSPRTAEEARHIGTRLGPPLMYLCRPGGLAAIGLSKVEMFTLGYRLLCDSSTALFAAYDAMAASYRAMAQDFVDGSRPADKWRPTQDDIHKTIGLDKLIKIEKETVEK
ncbi:MAG: isocitrate lyase/PEP mutase family protein [Candidatus Lambdaproteobacteria bacterium]|nr:isocitrate lyase/PEP mutase family protein [Candidatus Lambdaproteobacteria bacterium]